MENPDDQVPVWLRELCERLEDDTVILTVLNLNIRRVNRSMMGYLSKSLICKSTGLQSLNLTSALENRPGIMTSNQVLQPLIQGVLDSTTSSLKVLHLSYNALTDCKGIGTALSLNRVLTELHLDHNRIDCITATELASGLAVNQTLQVLQLSSNLIGDRGASNIAKALRQNKHLHTLCLGHNFIGRQGGQTLVDSLWKDKNTSLNRIDVENNPTFPADLAGWLKALCQANTVGRRILLFETDEVPGLVTGILARATNTPSALYVFLQEVQTIVPRVNEPDAEHTTATSPPSRKKARN
mmetsp:Transcript_14880/g.28407  ORF Transcript_14880/g.28407 Transcript_14880/m.28407 type:complete len:298 (-) Transcript_14880:2-895(-)|eukprot:scaffold2519_cov168-Amphora_coffeaeformis.AAC.31